jgi:hypothetical protein
MYFGLLVYFQQYDLYCLKYFILSTPENGQTFQNISSFFFDFCETLPSDELVIMVQFCTPDDALVVQNIIVFYIKILSQFVKPPSDTLLPYFNLFNLAPSPTSLQFHNQGKDSLGKTKWILVDGT